MATSKVGAKRSLFKKPAWASATTKPTEEDQPIFGQSHLYQEILQSEKERREKHAARQREREAKEQQKEQEQQVKRRRISKEAEDSDYGSDSDVRSIKDGSVASERSQKSTTPVQQEQPKSTSSTPAKRKTRAGNRPDTVHTIQTRSHKIQAAANKTLIPLDNDDDKDDSPIQSQKGEDEDIPEVISVRPSKSIQIQPDSESDEEDEYLRELKIRARQEARSKKVGTGVGEDNTSGSPAIQTLNGNRSPILMELPSPSRRTEARSSRAVSTPMDDETEVKIWIKTIIPGAREVIVNRKISQPLDKVKDFWIKRNELDPAIADRVFFIWNGTRLYNSTTMRGIIERLKKSHPMTDGSDPSDGHIMIEAVTDEIFEYRQNQRARRLAEAEAQVDNLQPDNLDSGANDEATGENGTPVLQGQRPGIVIKLKAQGLDEVNLRVRPNTKMQKILQGFRRIKQIDADTRSWLSYDGDQLDDEATVEEIGFEHEDTVDVYLR